MDAIQFEPMSISGIIDRAFTLYRRNFVRFITLVAVIQVPIALISLVWNAMLLRGMPDTSYAQAGASYETPEAATFLMTTGTLFVSILTAVVGNALCQGALARSISDAYLGTEATIGQTFRAVLPRLMTLIGASILTGLVVGLGIMLLVVPGVIFALWLFATTPSIVVENQGVTSGMSRSKALTSGNLGKVFAVSFLALIITMIISFPVGFVAGFLSRLLFSGNAMLALFFNQFAALIGQVLAMPIASAAAVLLYYDLRIRKEGFDLQMLAKNMATNQG